MISRRQVLIGGIVGAGMWRHVAAAGAKASQPRTPVNFEPPAGACDCHVHVFGDPRQFPFFSDRVYTPESASVEELRALHKALHIERIVVVQPSVYGSDNACTLDAIRQLGSRARGIAVINDKTTERDLDEMDAAGICGIRLNFATAGVTDPAAVRQRFQMAVNRVKGRNWHIQIFTQAPIIKILSDTFAASPIPVVFDHFGGAQVSLGLHQPGFGELVDLVKSGKAYVKISAAADLISTRPDSADVAPLAKALISANPQRILWGTNWPHPDSAQVTGRKNTDIAPLMQTDDGRVLNLLAGWVPDPMVRQLILTDNPAKLYRF
jgi:predicted TIM-barrel fold metal-dependent hydrolase